MTKQLVNLGTADKGNGDPLRIAFQKINGMFDELYAGGIGGASIVVSADAPDNPVVGALWFNDNDGRLYIYYDSFWVDTNPATGPSIPSQTGNAGKVLTTNGSTLSWTNEIDGGTASS